ncbi:MAG: alanine--tRNA ligase, partial [Clostridia bacterium]|nr:alanine--tRNA ligase [Clostridia bacterium]
QVSRNVMEMILDGHDVETLVLPIEEAKQLGATALFGEKYGDTVRVVKMGDYSLEFCGGTHLSNTAKVGPFRILSEASVASGVRRIEAYTGKEVLKQMEKMNQTIIDAANVLKTTPHDLIQKAHATVAEMKEMKQNVDKLKDKLFSGEIERTLFAAKEIKGLKVVTVTRSDIETNDLRKMGDFLKDRSADVVALLAAVQGEKITLNAVCGKNAIAKGIKAGDIIKNLAPICGGKGGGKPDSAMGGGSDVLKLDDMMAALDNFVAEKAKD